MIPRLAEVPQVVKDARAFVFDKDGTLLDLDTRWVAFFTGLVDAALTELDAPSLRAEILAALGVGPSALVAHGVAAAGTGADVRSVIIETLCASGHDRRASEVAVASAYVSAPMGALEALGHPARTIRVLRECGMRIGVATADDRSRTLADLDGLGLIELVDVVNCGDDSVAKPDPRVLTDMADGWGIDVGSIVMVGDSRHDFATARSAGAPFIFVGDGDGPGGEAWIRSVDEIAEVLGLDSPRQ